MALGFPSLVNSIKSLHYALHIFGMFALLITEGNIQDVGKDRNIIIVIEINLNTQGWWES